MKKLSFVAVFLSLALTCSAFTPAMAANHKEEKNLVKAEAIVTQTNEKIEDFVAHAQKTAKNDVAKLLAQVDKLAAQAVKQVSKLGYGVECTYTPYEVDGQIVFIDPLRVVILR